VTNSIKTRKKTKVNKLMSLFSMLKIIVSFFNIIVEVCLNSCLICQQAFECPVQRMMLAAVHAFEERLIE